MAQTQQVRSAAIVLDELDNDTDSSLGEEVLSSTTSISSSILNYRRENGRTYHAYKDGKYVLPNDEAENERLDLQHNLFLLTLDDMLGLAPPNEPDSKAKHVLDIGTGTGIWAIDYADEHPEAQVIGVDLSPIQPAFVPPNLTFMIEDIEDDWNYSHSFDYIHSRFMSSALASWTDFLTKCYKYTPCGYMEIQEADLNIQSDDGTLKPDNVMLRSLRLLTEASVKFGRPYQDIPPLADLMTKVGFVDVVVKQFRWPMNGWPEDKKDKLLGEWCYINMASGLEAFTMAPLTRAHGWTPEEVTLFLIDQRKAMADKNTHGYWPIYSIYGRKAAE
ncbi:methyltransferase [Fusarium langsethiae]|uniref:Methyltransferase n=1 Tax=Fusarium langsethiae TaxID=179993 RepID=A0A0N0V6K3_FUSLA|nr:methyltransferase [Fusarium langsethiae]